MMSDLAAVCCRITLISVALGACAKAPPSPELAAAQYDTCAPCHGANGEGKALVQAPAIAGQSAWYVEAQLVKFKEGARGAHPDDVEGLKMRPMSMSLQTPEDIKEMAKYVSGLPRTKPASTITADAAAGKTLYATCMACHGPTGEGNKALKAPALIGQHDWYLVNQIDKFKSGVRGSNPKDASGALMVPMAKTLPDDAAARNVTAHIMTLNK